MAMQVGELPAKHQIQVSMNKAELKYNNGGKMGKYE